MRSALRGGGRRASSRRVARRRSLPSRAGARHLFFSHAEDGIRHWSVTGVQTCALPLSCQPPSVYAFTISATVAPLSGVCVTLASVARCWIARARGERFKDRKSVV